MKKSAAIGVFDSGLGGLTSVKELKKILPCEDIIYFGDTARVPYGTHSVETIIRYATDDMLFLQQFDIKAVLVACGTVSSIALDTLERDFDIPVFGVVKPAAKSACNSTKSGRIALLGTPATVNNRAYEREISKLSKDASVFPLACPMFVPLVENGYIARDCEVTRLIAKEYLLQLCDFDPDVIILGCTHYPLLKDIIADIANDIFSHPVSLIDSGLEAACALKQELIRNNALSDSKLPGKAKYFVSDKVHDFQSTASRFLGEDLHEVLKADMATKA